MTAVFRNSGGVADDTATATFYVTTNPYDGHYLAFCTVVIPSAAHNVAVSAGCTAYGAPLYQYSQTHGSVLMRVVVNNPE